MRKSKIRILQGIRQGKIGGGESVLLSLVENLNKDLFEPVVLSFTDGPMVNRFKEMGIPVHVIHTEKPFDIRVWKKVKELMVSERIDLVHAHGTRAASNMLKAAKSAGLPFMYTCHGWSFHQDQGRLQKRLRIMGEQYITSRATVNICVSYANSHEGKKHFGRGFDPIVIQNSVDTRKFDRHKQYSDVREELGIDRSEILFTSIARFTWQKQPLILIQAFLDALRQADGIRLLMVGDGEQKAEAEELLRKHGSDHRIVLTGFRQDVADLLAASDVFVLPSLWEGLPVALLEAMAMGKAIIATDVDGTAEVMEHEKSGYLIGTENLLSALTAAIVKFSTDEALRHRLADGAAERINNHYNVDTMTAKNEEVYLNLMQPSGLASSG